MTPKAMLYVLGFLGQALFTMRFLVQWLASERRGASILPDAFWHLSLVGGATLLVYASLRQDPVFVVGQAAGLVVYARNLILLRRARERAT